MPYLLYFSLCNIPALEDNVKRFFQYFQGHFIIHKNASCIFAKRPCQYFSSGAPAAFSRSMASLTMRLVPSLSAPRAMKSSAS